MADMKTFSLFLFVFLCKCSVAQDAESPFNKYGPLQAKTFSSFEEAMKSKDDVYKLQSENEDLSKDIQKIKRLPHLQIAVLRNNRLSTLPTEMGALSELVYLQIAQNPLQHFPTSMVNWQLLEVLLLQQSALDSLPSEMATLLNLQTLQIHSNSTDTFRVGAAISKIPKLRSITIYNYNLHGFPRSITKCLQLKEVTLVACKIKKISTQIGNLQNLQTLILEGNTIETIPTSLFDLVQMKSLSLKDNNIKIVPEEIALLKKLELLDLRVTPISSTDIDLLRALMPQCKIMF